LDYIYALCEFGSYEEYCLQIFKVANEDKAKFEEYWEVLQKCGYGEAGELVYWIKGEFELVTKERCPSISITPVKHHQQAMREALERFDEMGERHYMFNQPQKVALWRKLLDFEFKETEG
jgi:hypothetical protein